MKVEALGLVRAPLLPQATPVLIPKTFALTLLVKTVAFAQAKLTLHFILVHANPVTSLQI